MNANHLPAASASPEVEPNSEILPAAAPGEAAPRRFGPLAESPVPLDDGGVVKSGVYDMTDSELVSATSSVVVCMKDNARFPNPTPSLDFVDAANQELQAVLNQIAQIKIALRSAMARRDAIRKTVEANYRAEASYVQSASNGNTNAIVSAGFLLRATPSPVGNLAAPVGLNLTLNGTIGVMYLTWAPVDKARSYMIQVSDAATLERDWKSLRISTATKQKVDNLEPGKTYAYRIAAIGGASGQSPWSAEVIRMAA
jgi:hypothetical protein